MANYETAKFFRIAGNRESGREVRLIEQTEKHAVRQSVYLVPFKMLSVSNFKFPFSSVARIREALRIQTVSYSSTDTIQIFPITTVKTSKEASGFTCFLPDAEIAAVESLVGGSRAQPILIPAPFVLASAVSGNGGTIWGDEENICSVIWTNGTPELYRWKARKSQGLEGEAEWLRKYCEAKERSECEIYTFDTASDYEKLPEIIKKSFTDVAWLKDVNLSRSAINSAMIIEKFAKGIARAAMWLMIVGAIFTGGSWLKYESSMRSVTEFREKSERLYRDVFGSEGRIVDPVSQARARINTLRGSNSGGKTIAAVLSDLSVPMKNASMDITLDSLRFNTDGADLTGSALDMATIQSFRSSLIDLGGLVQLGDVQQVPGGGFRFNFTLRWQQ